MIACETQILQRLAVLVMFHGLSMGKIMPHYVLVQRQMSWYKARDFCQRHYIDLAVLSTEEQYFSLINATAANNVSFWVGLHRQNISSAWTWMDGEELTYQNWYRRNYQGCVSLEAMLEKDKKLLARYCDEWHMFVCQGPVSPQPVKDSVGSDHVILSWNISAFMQMTPHSYNVTLCTNTCNTLVFHYTTGSTFMTIKISNLTSATEFVIEISAFVVRPEWAGEKNILQSNPTALQVKTVDSRGQSRAIFVILKLLKLVSLAPPLWILCQILKTCKDFPEQQRKHTLNYPLHASHGSLLLLLQMTSRNQQLISQQFRSSQP
ncbi:uncharacterized protein LOC132974461 isoform X1 [Labrus mixtus]|uniref:uncharacterized protein LOC132974461 isoform X1 n=1 Tax=Labrus mixtus TaxID=508554 RepID=UPI0029C0C278|nr:uncharacterized protein LOC132974461 isoform X1 [Labrus mixtus]